MGFTQIGYTIQVEFGHGDICVSPGLLKGYPDTGVVVFQLQAPAPIGNRIDHPALKEVSVKEAPVRLIFEKAESIDVVIWALQEAKRMMQEQG